MHEERGRSGMFPWVSDVDQGAWIAERLDAEALHSADSALGAMVPAGFERLVRVLHPFGRDRPSGLEWDEFWHRLREGPWDDPLQTVDEPVSWARVAAVHGRELGSRPLSFELLGFERYGEQPDGTEVNPDGWRYALPSEGSLDAGVLAEVASILAQHTTTPESGVAAVWEGYAGLVSNQGVAYFFGWSESKPWPKPFERVRQWWIQRTLQFRALRRNFGTRAALRLVLLPGLQQPPGSGLLPKEIATGPKLELPDRSYICFEAGIRDFESVAWVKQAPWLQSEMRSARVEQAQSPNLVWPTGREWVLLSEIDFDSTLIACSQACAEQLLATSGIEAMLIDRDTPLWQR